MLNEDPVVFMIDDKPHLLAAMKRVLDADHQMSSATNSQEQP